MERSGGMLRLFAKHTGQTGRQEANERRFGTPFDGSVIPFGGYIYYNPIYMKDKSRLHQFGTEMLPRRFIGYVLNS